MNSGAEGVETALKVARRWGYEVKGVPEDEATIIVMDGNFHGRTISIISFSGDHAARAHYGPYTPGFRSVPYGDADALEAAINDTTVAVLVEPVQGEAGVIVPPAGYLTEIRRLCDEHEVLMIADEIQSGLGRTGTTFACEHEAVRPGHVHPRQGARRRDPAALGGRGRPRRDRRAHARAATAARSAATRSPWPSAARSSRCSRPASHQQRAADARARRCAQRLEPLVGKGVLEIRVHGLWAGVDLDPALGTGRDLCEALARRGVLAKDTHGSTHPHLPAADHQRGGPGLGPGPARRGRRRALGGRQDHRRLSRLTCSDEQGGDSRRSSLSRPLVAALRRFRGFEAQALSGPSHLNQRCAARAGR